MSVLGAVHVITQMRHDGSNFPKSQVYSPGLSLAALETGLPYSLHIQLTCVLYGRHITMLGFRFPVHCLIS